MERPMETLPLNRRDCPHNPSATSRHVSKLAVAILVVVGLLSVSSVAAGVSWRVQTRPSSPITITASDLTLLVQSESAEYRRQLAKDEAMRKTLVKTLRGLLSFSEEARSKGFVDRPGIKLELEMSRARTISQIYWKSQGENATASPAEIEAFFKEPGQQERFIEFVKHENGSLADALTDEQRREIKGSLGRTLIGERRGIAAGLQKQRAVEVQIIFSQAGALATLYQQEVLVPMLEPTDAEIDKYIAGHPNEARPEAREIVKALKQQAIMNEITERHRAHIIMPADFTVSAPPEASAKPSSQGSRNR
jgi:hypothetical protein